MRHCQRFDSDDTRLYLTAKPRPSQTSTPGRCRRTCSGAGPLSAKPAGQTLAGVRGCLLPGFSLFFFI